jgi:tetratricopeptide (TPR) repeat protein
MVPTPIPGSVILDPPAYDEVRDAQALNNCGPATLAFYLRYFGWDGDQYDIAKIVKPEDDDRNVNVEELTYYVRNYAGWLNAEFRVGGDLDTLKELIASGIPVMIEETFTTDRKYWPEDDLWAGHYLLITGYDDANQIFTAQDSELGPNQKILYDDLDNHWQSFNRVYIMVYPPEMEQTLMNVLGDNWDADINRQHALETAQRETEEDPQNAFTWFNLGTNLTYFERYDEAASAYDTARTIGLPQRMLRYQFGPFISYFHSLRTDDLLALTKYALGITRTSEEAMLWRGWAFYRQGDSSTALKYFRDALKIHPNYEDAELAIQTVQGG